uniref:Uncharacterized protein n=1 Tax=Macaca fascicularis TaxID=9541 RepID=Q2PFS0_MACFA|nr:hypothetical protein [Macaca fascicularis]
MNMLNFLNKKNEPCLYLQLTGEKKLRSYR